MTTAFEPIQLGDHQLANRIAMSPMTRSRAYGPGASPIDLMATYYTQRSSAGLIVTEGGERPRPHAFSPAPLGRTPETSCQRAGMTALSPTPNHQPRLLPPRRESARAA